jgi:hypothetical protein
MPSRLIRPLLLFLFLIAIDASLTFWSQVGGQYHLDLMFWPWKFGLTGAAALLITAIARELYRSDPEKRFGLSRKTILYVGLLVAVILTAGIVTYYYHLNEPADEDNGDDANPTTSTRMRTGPGEADGKMSTPPYSRAAYQTRHAFADTIGLPAGQLKAF